MSDNTIDIKVTTNIGDSTTAFKSASEGIKGVKVSLDNFSAATLAANPALMAFVKANEALATSAKVATTTVTAETAAINTATSTHTTATNSTKGLSFATAGATRELIVLGHEAMTGNFSRIPGSMVVLAERMGNLQAIIPYLAAAFTSLIVIGVERAFEAAAEAAAKFHEENNKLAISLGVLPEEASKLDLQLKLVGASSRDYEQMALKLDRQVRSNSKALEEQGLVVRDSNKDILSQTELMQNAVKWLAEYKQGSDRNIASQFIFGRSIGEVDTIMKALSPEAEEAARQFTALGLSTTKLDVNASLAYRESTEKLSLAFKAIAIAVGDIVLPTLGDFSKWFVRETPTIIKWIDAITIAFVGLGDAITSAFHLLEATGAFIGGNFAESARQVQKALADPNIERKKKKPEIPETGEGTKDADNLLAQHKKDLENAHKIALERAKMDHDFNMDNIGEEEEKNRHLLAMGEQTNQQFLQQQIVLANERKQEDIRYYDDKLRIAKGNAVETAKFEEEATKARLKDSEAVTKAENKLAEDNVKTTLTARDSIISGFQGMTEKLIRGTATFRDAFKAMIGDLIVEFAKFAVKKVALMAWTASMEKIIAAESVATSLWASGVKLAIELKDAIFARAAGAVKAASATYASVAEIPYVGWALAPAAAAGAFAGVMAFGLPSAAGGWADVPNDGLAMIHKKEMVLPAPLAEKVRSMTDGSSSGGNTYHFNISALDGNSVKDMFMKNGGIIMQSLTNQTRNLNPNAMGAR